MSHNSEKSRFIPARDLTKLSKELGYDTGELEPFDVQDAATYEDKTHPFLKRGAADPDCLEDVQKRNISAGTPVRRNNAGKLG